MGEDAWLDIGEGETTAALPAVVSVPVDLATRVAVVEAAWAKLSLKQRTFLTAWRENGLNERKAARALGLSPNTKRITSGSSNRDFATVVQIWRSVAANEALDRDRLLARQEEIIDEALTPKPILHQGVPTGFEEVDLGVAARANEVLLDRVMPKPRDNVEVNVGVAFTPPSVEVVKPAGTANDAIDAKFVEVSPAIPKEDWLNETGTDSGAVLPE